MLTISEVNDCFIVSHWHPLQLHEDDKRSSPLWEIPLSCYTYTLEMDPVPGARGL